jgi:hypothetical protein
MTLSQPYLAPFMEGGIEAHLDTLSTRPLIAPSLATLASFQ